MGDRNIQFETETERRNFHNELFNEETISQFIQSSFNGNVLYLAPLDERRAMKHHKTSQFVEKICSNKTKIMSKIHRVGYGDIFSNEFKTK